MTSIKQTEFFSVQIHVTELTVACGTYLRVYATAASLPTSLVVYIEYHAQGATSGDRRRGVCVSAREREEEREREREKREEIRKST